MIVICRHPALTPRRRLRAFGLVDYLFALILVTIAANFGLQILDRYMVQQLARGEFLDLDAAAKAARGWVQANLSSELSAATTPHQIPISTLQAAGFWSPATPTVTPRNRAIEIWDYAANGNGVTVVAVASGAIVPPSLPEGDPALGPTVWISPLKPGTATGPGHSLDVTPFKSAAPGVFVPGSAMAVQYVSFAADAEPYLFRASVAGHPELNQMQTDLDMGGNAITNVGTFGADNLILSGAFSAPSATIGGDLTVTGTLNAANATVTNLTAGSVGVSTTLDASSAQTAIGTLNATSATIPTLTTTAIDVTDQATFGSASVTTFGTDTFAANTMTFNVLSVTGFLANQIATSNLSATTGLITTLTTSGCTGC